MAIEMNPIPYDIGDVAIITARFEVQDPDTGVKTLTDPTTRECKILLPDGTDEEIELVKVSDGIFRGEYEIVLAGTHYYRVTGTGAAASSTERGFKVQKRFVA